MGMNSGPLSADARPRLKTVERVLAWSWIPIVLGAAFLFANQMGWLRHADRSAFLHWALHEEIGLPIEAPAAQAFMRRFPPSSGDRISVTHVTKFQTRLDNGPVLDACFCYMRADLSRTEYVATLSDVREWAAESSYGWWSLIFSVVGIAMLAGREVLRRQMTSKLK
jgi:hypothetical protein